jgi:hypothetical protein
MPVSVTFQAGYHFCCNKCEAGYHTGNQITVLLDLYSKVVATENKPCSNSEILRREV